MIDGNDTAKNRLPAALIAGVLAFILFIWIIDFSFFWSLVWGVIVGVVVYYVIGMRAEGAASTDAGGARIGGGAAGGGAKPKAAADDAVDTGSVAPTPVTGAPADVHGGKAGAAVKPSKKLAGQDELAAKKGAWSYGDDAAGGKAKDGAKAATPSEPATMTGAAQDYGRHGGPEGPREATRPAALDAPRAGGADNLKEIKGVGPKLEKMLNGMGFYHFDQIAGWTDDEIAWVDANLKGFKGRVSRDNWVEQAGILASGGETEFSRRVDKGDVY